MPDPISGLTNMGATVPADDDELVVRDKSDTTQAGTGTTKRWSWLDFLRELFATRFGADAGSNDTYVVTLTPAPAAYVTGGHYRFKANTANTGACTINFNGLGAKTIKKAAGGITTDLADNDIRAGQWVDLVYDGTNMQMQSTLGNAPAAGITTEEVQDIVGAMIVGGTDIDATYDDGAGTVTIDGTGGSGMSNPMTTAGDIIKGGASGTPQRLAVGSEGQFLKVTGGVPAWGGAGAGTLNDPLGHHVQYQSHSNQSGLQTFGAAAAGANGTASNGADATGPFATYTSTTALNNDAGIFPSGGGFNTHQTRWDFTYYAKMKIGSVITELRMWAGVFSSNAHFASDTPASHYAAFRFTTGAGDTNWKCVTDNASGTPTVTDSGVAVVAGAVHEVKIVVSGDGASISFYIDGAFIATHTTTLPTNSTAVGPCVTARNLGSTNAKAISLQRMVVSTP